MSSTVGGPGALGGLRGQPGAQGRRAYQLLGRVFENIDHDEATELDAHLLRVEDDVLVDEPLRVADETHFEISQRQNHVFEMNAHVFEENRQFKFAEILELNALVFEGGFHSNVLVEVVDAVVDVLH